MTSTALMWHRRDEFWRAPWGVGVELVFLPAAVLRRLAAVAYA